MITNFLKSGFSSFESLPLISSMQGSQMPKSQVQAAALQLDKIVQEIMKALNASLSQKLGETIDGQQLKELTSDILKSKNLQSSLIETKQKYNDLVNKSTTLYLQAKKIGNSIGDFISSINMFLESDQLLVPLAEIQKGINQLLPEKVEKQINYLIKIFANNFQEIIDKNVRIVEQNMAEEIKVIKKLNKSLQNEIVSIKGNKNNDESKYLEQAMKISSLNDKIAKLLAQKTDNEKDQKQSSSNLQQKLKLISEQDIQIKRLKQGQVQLLQKIKQSQLKSTKVGRQFREQTNESQALSTVIQRLKANQEEMMEQLQAGFRKKEMLHESLRKKMSNQKTMLEEKIQRMSESVITLEAQIQAKNLENTKLNAEVVKLRQSNEMEIDFDSYKNSQIQKSTENENKEDLKEQQSSKKESNPKRKMTLKDIIARISNLQGKNKALQSALAKQGQGSVNKQVLKGLFVGYDDESKEWACRRNIKYQIYTLLDMKDKIPKATVEQPSKWFGLF